MRKLITAIPFVLAGAAAAAAAQEGNVRDVIRINDSSYMVVFPFESHRQYAEFSNNKKILADSFKEMNDAKARAESEKDAAKKEALERELAQKTEAFQANDQAMVKGYNYTSGRTYIELFLKTFICTPVSDEEFSMLEFKDGTKMDPLKIVKSGSGRFYRSVEIDGFQNNQDFQGVLAFIMARRVEMSKLRDQVAEQTDMEKVSQITSQIAKIEDQLKEKIKVLKEKYGIETDSKYMVEIDKARLLILLTPEELVQMQAGQKQK